MTQTSTPARIRRHSLAGASLSALVLAIVSPHPAAAQSFQGTGSVTTGSASITTGANTTDVSILSGQVVIDWTTTDASGTGNVIFQPAGTTATFADSSINGSDYTVLNRIIPVDAGGNPTNASIQFDGTVNSTLFGQTGGNVWFYSPNGVILGATATFNVGGLVLTTNPIDTTGGLYGPSGEIRFAGPAGSLAPVTIQSGAQINALLDPQAPGNAAYVALVAPHIEQAGSVRSDGSIAYVAAEVADITINAGLFDINVTTGTTDASGIVHTGKTGGSASTGAADLKTIYMVAMGKNDGLTMLLNGGIGYDPAAVATNDGSTIVLSAGHGLGFDSGSPLAATASIAIGDARFTSVTTARATDTITVTPTGTTAFDRFAALDAINRVELDALGGAQIVGSDTQGMPADLPFSTGYSLELNAGYANQGGTVAVNVDGGALTTAGHLRMRAIGDANDKAALSIDGIGGTVAVNLGAGTISANNLEIDVNGYGQNSATTGGSGTGGSVTIASAANFTTNSIVIGASGFGGGNGDIGGDGNGGSIQIAQSNGGTMGSTSISLGAAGSGGYGVTLGGNGTGGTIGTLVDTGGTIGRSAGFFNSAPGFGGYSNTQGGDATGGAVTLIDNGGVLDFTNVSLDASASGASSDGNGGDAFGGTILTSLAGNSQSWSTLYLDASAYAGETYTGLGVAGSATADLANGVRLAVQGVALNVDNYVELYANAYTGAAGTGTYFGRAGSAVIDVSAGGSLTAGSDVSINAGAGFSIEGVSADPDYSPDMTGGNAALFVNNGTVTVPSLTVQAYAFDMGALVNAGTATGGTAQVAVSNNGSLVVDSTLAVSAPNRPGLNIIATAFGGYETQLGPTFGTVVDGYASAAQGGTANLALNGGTIDVADDTTVSAQGTGGPSNTIGGADSQGNGTGGTALVSIGGGTMTLAATLDVLADGIGGTIKGGAKGGSGLGGLAALDASGGSLFVNGTGLTISADGLSNDVDPAVSGSSGDAAGGQARLRGSGGNIIVTGDTLVRARGVGGAAGTDGIGGSGTGGLAQLSSGNGGTVTLGTAARVLASGFGGAGTAAGALGGNAFGGSATAGQTGAGTMAIATDLLVDASATGGANSVDSLVQGLATGGNAGLDTGGGALQVGGNVSLTADATGGSNPGGTAPPTVAGFIKIGGTSTPTGTLAVGGSLNASAKGAATRTDGQGLALRTADAALSVTGDTTMTVTGDAVLNVLGTGSFDTGGALTITSTAGQITGTGLLSSGGNMLISGMKGVSLDRLTSGGTTGLFSTIGPVTVADLLSAGPVTVSGLSVSIGSSGGLTFADADATGGALSINVTDNLVAATVDATGAVTLASGSGSVTTNGAVNGAGVAITAGQNLNANAALASSGAMNLTAGGSATLNGNVSATGPLGISAGQMIAVNALASGSAIRATSQDVAIGAGGQIGQRGTTATVSFVNSNGGNTSYIGGTAVTGGYSLDNGEFQQVFADNAIAFAVQPGTGTGEIAVGALDLDFGTGRAIGSGGAFLLSTDGRISVAGDVALTTSSAPDTFGLTAGSVEVSTDRGSIALADGSGNGLGVLRVTADRFVAATSGTIGLLDSSLGIDEVNALMDAPGTGPARGSLFAGAIVANVTDGIYVQNLGASTGYADRRGFTARSLAITTGGTDTRIVVNGVIVDPNGNPVTGLGTAARITVNGTAAIRTGAFDPLSTVNGCVIGLSCILLTRDNGLDQIVRTKPDLEGSFNSGNTTGSLLSPPAIQIDVELRELDRSTALPLVDEPVTGVGNEDLWGDSCSSEKEGCTGGQSK